MYRLPERAWTDRAISPHAERGCCALGEEGEVAMGITRRAVSAEQFDRLVERGLEEGCLELSEISQLIADEDLDEREIDRVFKQLEERGIEVKDDCGRDGA